MIQLRKLICDGNKGKGMLAYRAIYNTSEHTKRFQLHRWHTCSFLHQLDLSGTIKPHNNYCARTMQSHVSTSGVQKCVLVFIELSIHFYEAGCFEGSGFVLKFTKAHLTNCQCILTKQYLPETFRSNTMRTAYDCIPSKLTVF